MGRDAVKSLVDMIPDEDLDIIYSVLVRFVPEDSPLPDEIEAIKVANRSIAEHGTVPHDAINWD